MTKSKKALALMLVMALFGLVACGGDDDDGGDTAGDGTSEGFVAAATEACEKASSKAEELQQTEPANEDEAVELFGELQTLLVDAKSDLENANPQTDEQKEFVEEFSSVIDEAVPAIDDLIEATENRDIEALQNAQTSLNVLNEADLDSLAEEAGLEDCNPGS